VWYYVLRNKSKNYLLHLVVPTLGLSDHRLRAVQR
jgi:hypothetical protein